MTHSRREFLILPAAAALAAHGAETGEVRLIIQGDDMGAAHSINTGTIRAYKEGILRTANVIVPGPWLLEAAKLIDENPGLDAGVHLALTSEWSYLKWRPLTGAPSLVDSNGYFFPMVFPAKLFPPGASIKEGKPKTDEVEKELRAQIETGRRLMPGISYVSTHMGFSGAFPGWQALVKRLAAEYSLHLAGDDPEIRSLGHVWDLADAGDARSEKLVHRLETLEQGTWRMIDHAAVDDAEMRAISHPGYENVAADREAVRQAWSSPRVLEVVSRRKIKLVGYRDISAR